MHLLWIILVLLIGGMFIICAASASFSSSKIPRWKRIATFAGSGLLVIGGCGFFGSALSAVGGLNWLPDSFEWPVGYAQGVVTTSDNYNIVPHTPSGRIQVYDPHWNFVTGWHVGAGGEVFKLDVAEDDNIHVITGRTDLHYVFEKDGTLISKDTCEPAAYDLFPDNGKSIVVATAPWLWPFSNPIISWAVGAIGAGLLFLGSKQDIKIGIVFHLIIQVVFVFAGFIFGGILAAIVMEFIRPLPSILSIPLGIVALLSLAYGGVRGGEYVARLISVRCPQCRSSSFAEGHRPIRYRCKTCGHVELTRCRASWGKD